MRALLLHVNKFVAKIIEKSTRPKNIKSAKIESDSDEINDGVAVLFCIEKNDGKKQIENLYKEIIKTASEIKTNNLMLAPFVHLSNNIAEPEKAKIIERQLIEKFKNADLIIHSSYFGYHKNLILDIKGHPGAFRYREF